MEYLKFYELGMEPFQNDPDDRFYFESAGQRRARLWLQRGIQQRKGLCVVVGGPGCGKTTLAHHLADGLGDESYCARLLSISHSECANGWLLPHVAAAFGVRQPGSDAPTMIEQVQHELVGAIAAGRLPVLIVDEAQLLAEPAVMEEFRGLLNLAHGGRKLLSILLFGLAELSTVLKLDAPLAQRVEIRCDLGPLPRDETLDYVKHRLETAGGSTAAFTSEALDAVHAYTEGIPRLINTLADNALFEGFIDKVRPVDVSVVAACAEQLELAPRQPAAEVSPNDFSMGSVVRSVPGAPEAVAAAVPVSAPPPPPAAPAPRAAARAASARASAPAQPVAEQAAPTAAVAVVEEQGGQEAEADLEIELEVAEAEAVAEPAPAAGDSDSSDDELFDPGELLLEDDDDERPTSEPEAESEELDGLFESIQVD